MLNQCSFIGHAGSDPEIRTMSNGNKVANLSIGVSEKWKDRDTGEKREKTTWVPVVIFGKLVDVVERYVNKGDKLFIQGAFQVRKWQDRDQNDRWSTEIVLQGFNGTLEMLGSPSGQSSNRDEARQAPQDHQAPADDFDDLDVPF